MHFERTIARRVQFKGIGLHSGKFCSIEIFPAEPGTGIVFIKSSNGSKEEIPAHLSYVTSTVNASTIGSNGQRVQTVEHLLASLYGLGIDNVRIKVEGDEIPILDGSAKYFVNVFRDVGVICQEKPKRFLVVKRAVRVEENGDKYAELLPSEGFSVDFVVSYPHPLLNFQRKRFSFSEDVFAREISPARTFGFLEEVNKLRENGLGLGGSLENVIVLDKDGVLNPEGLRFEDEFVRHKILDSFGDLMLLGMRVIGEYRGFRSGHSLNLRLLRVLVSNRENYEIIEASDEEVIRKNGLKVPFWLNPSC